jgi:Uma2 family endonuclease
MIVKAASAPIAPPATAADLLMLIHRLGGIDPARVRLHPAPGTATVKDLVRANAARTGALCELVFRTLVEKAMGAEEDYLGTILTTILNNFVLPRNLGAVFGASAPMQMHQGNVRLPDASFITAERWAEYLERRPAVAPFAPDFAIEVLSRSNTRAEMDLKRREYFASGTRLVWEITVRRRTVTVYTGFRKSTRRTIGDTLDGGDVLPDFRLPVADLFAYLARRP